MDSQWYVVAVALVASIQYHDVVISDYLDPVQ